MIESEVRQLIQKYGTSWYATVDRIEPRQIAPQGAKEQALRELNEPGAVVAVMEENIRDATYDRDGIRARYERAQADGLFDPQLPDSVPKKLRTAWQRAVNVQRRDRDRCVAELRHWREYAAWAAVIDPVA